MKIIGQYAEADVMIDQIDAESLRQIYAVCNSEYASGSTIKIMPDVHAGSGCVIGFTQKYNRGAARICPSLVGVDIGCSVSMEETILEQIDLDAFEQFIRSNIPMGTGSYYDGKPFENHFDQDIDLIRRAEQMLLEDGGTMRVPALKQLLSLGSGNHFIELGRNSKGKICISIHTGSRNFGLTVCNTYQRKAEETVAHDCPKELRYLSADSEYYYRYMTCVQAAEALAHMNHYFINDKICEYLIHTYGTGCCPLEKAVVTSHNYVEVTDDSVIIRKGAVSAKAGEELLIPLTAKDGILVCTGKGNIDWNESAPHGAGRVLSRSQAKASLSADILKQDMQDNGVYSTWSEYALDESPAAYKDPVLIKDAVAGAVVIDDIIKPIYSAKGK